VLPGQKALPYFARALLAAFLFILIVSFAGAQEPGQQPIRVGVSVVRVPAWVVDTQGRAIVDLHASDFRILENGKEQKVALFDRGVDPVHVALVVDTSQSTAPFLDALVDAARQFSQRFGSEDQLAVYEAGPQVVRIQGFTNSREAVLDALHELRTADSVNSKSARRSKSRAILKQNTGRGGTLLYDAMMLVKREFPDEAARRVIILFTDGWDSGSDNDFRSVRNTLLLGNEQIFTVLARSGAEPAVAGDRGQLPPVPEQPRAPETWAVIFDTLTLHPEVFDHYERVAKAFLSELNEEDRVWLFSYERALSPMFVPPARLNASGELEAMQPSEALPALPQLRLPAAAREPSKATSKLVLPDRVLFLTEEASVGSRQFLERERPVPGSYVLLAPEEMTDEAETRAAMQTLIRPPEGARRVREHIAVTRQAALENRLPQLALDSGGSLFPMRTSKELEGIYQQIADQIRTSYTLGYYTEAASGRHRVEVLVKNSALRVHARRALVVK